MASGQWSDHLCEFETSGCRSCPPGQKIPGGEPWMCRWQTVETWLCLPGQKTAKLSRTTESEWEENVVKIEKPWRQWITEETSNTLRNHSCLTKYRNLVFSTHPPIHTWIELDWYLWYSVLAFKSSISIVGRPEISNSSSCSVKMEMSLFGIIS